MYNEKGDKMIKYPNGKKINTSITPTVSTKTHRRGMSLEKDLNISNEVYLARKRAIIHKKPTPVQVVKVDYPSRAHAKIVEAYYKVPSTTDYNGIYRGKYLDFEAKETASKVSFTFKSIHPHQIKHLQEIIEHDGIAFVIIRFSAYDQNFLVKASDIVEKYHDPNIKSLAYKWCLEHAYLISTGLYPRLDYLAVVDEIFFN